MRVLLALAIAALLASSASAAGGWHSAQPLPEPAPEGERSIEVPVPLGHIGQISFWAPNRGVLITQGTEAVAPGLFYYNGVSWRRLSTVCGGTDGRIAWAGPDDFWTISDMQVGQRSGPGGVSESEGRDRSLCHFQNGKVVASYAEPLGLTTSYGRMFAAACSGPSDCWFAGERLEGALNSGAFHLHWNGSTLTPLPSPEVPEPGLEDPPQNVRSLISYGGHFYEGVQPEGSPEASDFIHKLIEGSSRTFQPLLLEGPPGQPFTFNFNGNGETSFQFSAAGKYLWAAAPGTVLLLNGHGQFQQLLLADPSGALSEAYIGGVAAEPGTDDAWISVDLNGGPEGNYGGPGARTRVTRIHAPVGETDEASIDPLTVLPEAGEALGDKGSARAITCPAQGDCWVVTVQGWLFHLGPNYPEDQDPNFQKVITYRPPDASLPFIAPETFPEDDSGAIPQVLPPLLTPPPPTPPAPARVALYSHVKEQLVGRTRLRVTFTLATRSRVRLLALRHHRRVAQSRGYVLAGGRHALTLRVHRRAWPTRLELRVRPLGPVP
ncbi:MAG: hypothetical protein FWD42_00365 [Solirubrobacterales bacterium]|nr:hypothetical protein [Solirubrobacterales bacterium]